MRENRLRGLWENGEYAVNGWLHLANSFAAEVMVHQGWDSLTIDLQHGLIDFQAISSPCSPIGASWQPRRGRRSPRSMTVWVGRPNRSRGSSCQEGEMAQPASDGGR